MPQPVSARFGSGRTPSLGPDNDGQAMAMQSRPPMQPLAAQMPEQKPAPLQQQFEGQAFGAYQFGAGT